MSVIKKLSIMGVRAFGPNADDKQVIEFYHPLTLIFGNNGSGKTTIIECLKYATTGDHPQNTKGGAFVHDPKLVYETEVKAKVQLSCINIYNEPITIERGMQVTQKQKTVQFKTQDGVISKIKKDGQVVQLTSKCAELNREMVSSLGVSLAVLENVIFCHQEDSNWPLSEGKVVKQRFDDIFAATRYIKALEEIKRVQKGQKNEVSQLDRDLVHFKGYCESKEKKVTELQKIEGKLEAAKRTSTCITEELTPLKKEIKILVQKRDETRELQMKLQANQNRYSQLTADKEKLRNRIHRLFEGTDDQLNDLLMDEDTGVSSLEKEECKFMAEIEELDEEMGQLTEKKSRYSTKKYEISIEMQSTEEKRKKRDEMIIEFAHKINYQLDDDKTIPFSSEQVKDFGNFFEDFNKTETTRLNRTKHQLQDRFKEAEKSLQEKLEAQTELKVNLAHLSELLKQKKEKQAKNLREVSRSKSASDNDELQKLQTAYEEMQEKLKQAVDSINTDQVRMDIKRLVRKKTKEQQEIMTIEKDIKVLQKSIEQRAKISCLKKEVEAKENKVAKITSDVCKKLSQLGFPMKLSTNQELNQIINEKEEEIKKNRKNLENGRVRLSISKSKLETIKNEMKEKEDKIKSLDDSLFEACGSQDLDSDISIVESEIEELQKSRGLLLGTQHLYKDYIKKLKTCERNADDTTCPLCYRTFDDVSEVKDLTLDLEKKLKLAPKKLETKIKELKTKEDRHKILLNQKPIKNELDQLSKDLPKLKKESKDLDKKIKTVEKEVEENEEKLEESLSCKVVLESASRDLNLILPLQAEIKEQKRKVRSLECELPENISAKSIDELNADKNKLNDSIEDGLKAIENKRKEIDDKNDEINLLREQVNKAQEEKLDLTSQLQKCEQIRSECENLTNEISQLKKEISEKQQKLNPLINDVENARLKKEEIEVENEKKLSEERKKLEAQHQAFQEIEKLMIEVDNYDDSGYDLVAEKISKKLNKVENGIEFVNKRQKELRGKIADLQKKIASFATRKKELEDNRALRDKDLEIKELQNEIKRMASSAEGGDDIERELNEMCKKRDLLNTEKEKSDGRREVLNETIKSLQSELNQKIYKTAEETYKNCVARTTLLSMAADDLGKYYKALDQAIMKFHKVKMDEINKIIRELWQQTYRGRDIDYIEICSNDDTGSLTSSRRVFNYRVVMHTGSVQMDMRGRCSAGQKILASLVIRLALAETFCINCGVMALDEPTTNLDRENIESLAEALISIIESRSKQRNFQLIVITHDEDFIELLSRASYAEHYYSVTKDDNGKSRIAKMPIRLLEN